MRWEAGQSTCRSDGVRKTLRNVRYYCSTSTRACLDDFSSVHSFSSGNCSRVRFLAISEASFGSTDDTTDAAGSSATSTAPSFSAACVAASWSFREPPYAFLITLGTVLQYIASGMPVTTSASIGLAVSPFFTGAKAVDGSVELGSTWLYFGLPEK